MNSGSQQKYEVIKVDFRDQLRSRFSPFIMEASRFLGEAISCLNAIKNQDEQRELARAITNDWLDLLNMRDVVDLGFMPSKAEMADFTGMSLEEVLLLEATAYAERLALDITPLEKAAVHHKIYGPNFPGRSQSRAPSYPYRDDLNGEPRP